LTGIFQVDFKVLLSFQTFKILEIFLN